MQLRWSPTEWHMGDPPDQTAPSSGLSPALATERISLHDSTFQGRLVMVDVLTGHGDTIVIQQAKCVKIWGREGRLGHVEVFLQMCSFVTSIFERPRLFLCLQHARIRKLIYTQNSEEPLLAQYLPGMPAQLGWQPWVIFLAWWFAGAFFYYRLPRGIRAGEDVEERLARAMQERERQRITSARVEKH